MTKPTYLLSLLLLTLGVVVAPATTQVGQPTYSAIAQSNNIESTVSFRNLLRRIFPDDERDDPTTISRGDFCLLAPARPGEETTIWHQKPVFIWQGTIGKLEVVDDITGERLWQYEPAPDETFVSYEGEQLKAGSTYVWKVYSDSTSETAITFPPFTILPAINRLLIANGLSVARDRAIAADNPEENPPELANANYFAFRDLPVDALQSLFTVENPSADLVEGRAEIVESMCE